MIWNKGTLSVVQPLFLNSIKICLLEIWNQDTYAVKLGFCGLRIKLKFTDSEWGRMEVLTSVGIETKIDSQENTTMDKVTEKASKSTHGLQLYSSLSCYDWLFCIYPEKNIWNFTLPAFFHNNSILIQDTCCLLIDRLYNYSVIQNITQHLVRISAHFKYLLLMEMF